MKTTVGTPAHTCLNRHTHDPRSGDTAYRDAPAAIMRHAPSMSTHMRKLAALMTVWWRCVMKKTSVMAMKAIHTVATTWIVVWQERGRGRRGRGGVSQRMYEDRMSELQQWCKNKNIVHVSKEKATHVAARMWDRRSPCVKGTHSRAGELQQQQEKKASLRRENAKTRRREVEKTRRRRNWDMIHLQIINRPLTKH